MDNLELEIFELEELISFLSTAHAFAQTLSQYEKLEAELRESEQDLKILQEKRNSL